MKTNVTFTELANIFATIAKADAINAKRFDLETRYDEMLDRDFDEIDLDAKIDLYAELRKARKDCKKAFEKCFEVLGMTENTSHEEEFIMSRLQFSCEYGFISGAIKRLAVELPKMAISE